MLLLQPTWREGCLIQFAPKCYRVSDGEVGAVVPTA
jgi:hypothetical protein